MKGVAKLRDRLRIGLTRDWTFVPGGERRGGVAQQLLVIAPRAMPTIDYYLRDLLSAEPASRHRLVFDTELERWAAASPATSELAAATRVVLVRMPRPGWADVIRALGERVIEVVWLIDDDVVAARSDAWLPPDYRRRLLADYLRFKRAFEELVDRVWASTPVIAERFPATRVELHPPQPIELVKQPWRTIFYHGTGAHRREHAFLRPVLEQVQARLPHTIVEVAGDHAVYRMYRGIPRLRVLHPMPWSDYLAHLGASRYQIGLAPLLDTPFNRGRSGIKALEIAAVGAQGVLSRRSPYLEHENLPGMHLVGDSPDEWAERIVSLVGRLA